MYTLIDANGEMFCKVKCLACSLEITDGVLQDMVELNSKCHHTFLHQKAIQPLVTNTGLRQRFTAVFTVSELLKYALDLNTGVLIAEIDCDAVRHDNADVTHAVGDVRLLQTHTFGVDFLKTHMPLELDTVYEKLMMNAVTFRDAAMCHFLWQTRPDYIALQKVLFIVFLTCSYACRIAPEELLQFVISLDILDEISVMILALGNRIPYQKYLLTNLDNVEAQGYDILYAISSSTWSDDEAWEIFQELASRGFRIKASMLLGRPCCFLEHDIARDTAVYTSITHVSFLRYVMESDMDIQREIDAESLGNIFIRCFMIYNKTDWSFFPENLAKSYVQTVSKCADAASFRRYLQIWFTDRDEYEQLFLELFDKHESHSKILLERVELTPELCIACQNRFSWPRYTTEFSVDYVKFLIQDLGIEIDTQCIMRAVVYAQIKPDCLFWLLENHAQAEDCNRPFAKADIYSAENKCPIALSDVSDVTLMEVIFYHHSVQLDVERMASDLNLELDYHRLCKILWQISEKDYACSHRHELCPFINMARHDHLYAVMKCLHLMQPTHTLMAEIWNAVCAIYPEGRYEADGPKNHAWYRNSRICRDYRIDNTVNSWTQLERSFGRFEF